MKTLEYDGFQINNGDSKKIRDHLVREAAIQININNVPYTVVMRTPGDDFELIRGLLYAEDIYKNNEPLNFELKEQLPNGFSIINIPIPKKRIGKGYMNKRTLLSVSSCGICGKQTLDAIAFKGAKLKTGFGLNLDKIPGLFNEMLRHQITFGNTGGSHAAALFDRNYELMAVKEDIGRHNAVDKVIGDLLIKKSLDAAYTMLVSGRVSYEIIVKAFAAKIRVVIAVSACSSLAVDFAKEFGICLIGFSRGSKATIYAPVSI